MKNPKPQKGSPQYYRWIAFPFWITFLASFIIRCAVLGFTGDVKLPRAVLHVSNVGFLLFGYCLIKLYVERPKHLLTNGVFRFTRHPMYTGFLIMSLSQWWPGYPLTIGYWVSLSLFLIGMIVAGYFQEKETIAKFGAEAEEYYRRTPRLFLLYPYYYFVRR